jgi:hypothetical protein
VNRNRNEREERIFNSFLFSAIHVKAIHFPFFLIIKANRIVIESYWTSQNAKRIAIENVCLSINYCVIRSCFNSLQMNLCIRNFSKSLFNLLVIDLHFLQIMFDMFAICIHYLIWICNWFKFKSMKLMCVSFFKIEIEVIRNDSKMFCEQRFYMIANLLIILDFLFLSMCQIKTS